MEKVDKEAAILVLEDEEDIVADKFGDEVASQFR